METGVTGSPAPAVIFDLDGTLIDSVPDLQAAVNRMLAGLGVPEMDRAEVQSYVGNGAPVLVQRVMQARAIAAKRHAELMALMVADYTTHSADLTTVHPNVREALASLQAAGHPLAICTNKPAAATRSVLAALKLGGHFTTVIAGDTLAQKKPHPAPLLAARDALGATACLFVGDSEVDGDCAAAAGVPFALFTEGYLRVPEARVAKVLGFSDFAALPAFVSRYFGH